MFTRVIIAISLVFCVSVLQAQPGATGKPQRIGYADVEALLSNMSEFKEVQTQLKTHREMLGKQLGVKEQYFQGKMMEYQELVEQGKAEKDKQAAMESELMKLKQEIDGFRERAENDLMEKQEGLLKPVSDKVQKAVDEVSVEHGYAFVFSKSMNSGSSVALTGLLRAPKEDDLTDRIAKKLGVVIAPPKPIVAPTGAAPATGGK